MVLAVVSWEAFWGDFCLVLGSVLALFSLVMTGMTTKGLKKMAAASAISLAVGAAFRGSSELHAYGNEHFGQALLAGGTLIGVVLYVIWRIARAQKSLDDKSDAGADQHASENPRKPSESGALARWAFLGLGAYVLWCAFLKQGIPDEQEEAGDYKHAYPGSHSPARNA
jgi:hypothetical protein